MILAGHGKDDRLIQVELPIVPNVGDRIREDSNPKDGSYHLDSLIREGKFVKILDKYGSIFWDIRLDNGKETLFSPSDCEIIDRAPVLVEKEISLESLLEQPEKPYVLKVVELPFDYDIPVKEQGNECYTPDYVLDLCREFLGGFDLDPFSNAIAQRSVKAKKFWTKEDNSLIQDWTPYLKKWCNPPYNKLSTDGCIDKILKYKAIGETILLVNSSTSAKWFHKCMESCTAYVHPSKRIGFYNPYSEIEYLAGKPRSSNNFDQTIFYFGDRPLEFAEALASLGNAVQPIRKPMKLENTALRITEDRQLYDLLNPICNWYCGKSLATFAVNALGHALSHARNRLINEAVSLLTDQVIAEIKKPSAEIRQLKQFLFDFSVSIDGAKLPIFANAIATESSKSVASLRMDESKVSVLVEIDQSVLVEKDRYQFLLERREQLINSGASPQGVWINCGKVPHRDFRQAVWKSDKPRAEWGDKKSCYIGKFDGDEHKSAIAQHRAGQELRKVEREIKKLSIVKS